jgi:ribosome recycling factor
MKVKLYVNRLAKIVNEEVETLDKSRQEVFDKYAKGEKKEIAGDDVKLFYDEIEELMLAKKKIDVTTLWSTDLTINDLASIETEENYPIFYRLVDNKE